MTSPPPNTRKAWRVTTRGSPARVLRLDSIPMPTLERDEVLVKVYAAALNPAGYKLMSLLPNLFAGRPNIAEYEFSGTVAAANGTDFIEGEAVFGYNLPNNVHKNGEGAIAEYVKTKAVRLIRSPTNLTHVEASGVVIAYLTAWDGLVTSAQIQPGQTVFINGGSSSVGRFAIQLGKLKGCKVVTSCSPGNMEGLKALGADEVFDYTSSLLHEQLIKHAPSPKYNVFFDAVGVLSSDLYTSCPHYLQPSGIYVTSGPSGHDLISWLTAIRTLLQGYIQPKFLGGVPRRFKLIQFTPQREHLEQLKEYLSDGSIIPQIDSVFGFEDTLRAYERIQSNRARGKVVVSIP